MDEYRASYLVLFNAVTDAIEMLERQDFGMAKGTLIRAQQDAEEKLIEAADN